MFETLDKKNAKAFFELYMSRKETVLAEFAARSEATGGPKASELDFSKHSLAPLWAWICRNTPFAAIQPPLELLPPWYSFELITNRYNPDFHLTPAAAANVDGFSYYWGETLLKHIPDTKWDIDPYPKDISFCKPVILSDFFVDDPITFSSGMIAGYNNDAKDKRYWPASIAERLEYLINSEKEYRAECAKAGEQVDWRVKKRVIFK